MRNLKKVLAGMMALIMCLMLMMVVSYADPEPFEAKVSKKLNVGAGVSVAPAKEFTFGVEEVTSDAPPIADFQIGFSGEDTSAGFATKESADFLPDILDFPHAGIYEYIITETIPGTVDDTITYSLAEYKFLVCVVNDGDDLKFEEIVIQQIKDDAGEDIEAPDDGKRSEAIFENKYVADALLTIDKTVTGDYADKTKDFDFDITFFSAVAPATDMVLTGTIIGTDGNPTGTTVDVTIEAGETSGTGSFQLKHGESIEFEAKSGITYTVAETGDASYVGKATVTENGTASAQTTAAQGDDLTAENDGGDDVLLIGADTNSVSFVNECKTTTPTGIIINNLPFIVLILIAVAAIVLYARGKRRKANNA